MVRTGYLIGRSFASTQCLLRHRATVSDEALPQTNVARSLRLWTGDKGHRLKGRESMKKRVAEAEGVAASPSQFGIFNRLLGRMRQFKRSQVDRAVRC